jgi:GGDEF domain-containing protein
MGESSMARILGWVSKRPEKPGTILPGFVDLSTGLPTRASIIAQVESALRKLRGKKAVSLLFFNFADIEGTILPGDIVGNEIARLLRMWIPPEHVVGHMRDREFAVLIRDGLPLNEVERLADHVINRMRTTSSLQGKQRSIVTMVGVAHTSKSKCTPSELLRNADIALSRARSGGRGRYEIIDHVPLEQAA